MADEPKLLTFEQYTNSLTSLVRAFNVYVNTKRTDEINVPDDDKEYPDSLTLEQWGQKFDMFIASPHGQQARKII